ncbi:protein of unknown function [Mesotoga infera]|uniref:Uncharacterized protein n=1 Tax=Mesotoga infera TaxID=1236046 RepID=A0A7Z7LES0_9BACT|nr:protein of unknown function [Mesotoga infera]
MFQFLIGSLEALGWLGLKWTGEKSFNSS